jgi:predicted SpoU family rRNA methylase
MTNHYYRKRYLVDMDEGNLVERVNNEIRSINPANLFGVDFTPVIQTETTFEYEEVKTGRKVHETCYGIKYTCVITELVEERG